MKFKKKTCILGGYGFESLHKPHHDKTLKFVPIASVTIYDNNIHSRGYALV